MGGGGAGGGAVTGRGLALVTALVRDHRHAATPLLPPRRALLALGPAREPAQVPLHHLAPLRVALLHLVVGGGGGGAAVTRPAPALVTVGPGLEVGDEGADPDAPLHEVVLRPRPRLAPARREVARARAGRQRQFPPRAEISDPRQRLLHPEHAAAAHRALRESLTGFYTRRWHILPKLIVELSDTRPSSSTSHTHAGGHKSGRSENC